MKWKKVEHSWSDTSIKDETGRTVCTKSIYDAATEANQANLEKQVSKEFDLIAKAPELKARIKQLEEQNCTLQEEAWEEVKKLREGITNLIEQHENDVEHDSALGHHQAADTARLAAQHLKLLIPDENKTPST